MIFANHAVVHVHSESANLTLTADEARQSINAHDWAKMMYSRGMERTEERVKRDASVNPAQEHCGQRLAQDR